MLPHLLKPLLKRLSDKVEKNRELAILILKEFFSKVEDLTLAFPYLFPVLLERLNAVNIEGTDGLPEQMMPPTAQKAQTMTEIIEPSEEVRLQIAELMSIIVSSTIPECFRAYLDDVSNILRALCMDPAGEVIYEGCHALQQFCENCNDLLLHFCTNLGRSTFTALTHKHAKVRIAGLKALYHAIHCGAYKYAHEVFELLVGFRDPNLVPIKDFFEPTVKINYFALLVVDRSV